MPISDFHTGGFNPVRVRFQHLPAVTVNWYLHHDRVGEMQTDDWLQLLQGPERGGDLMTKTDWIQVISGGLKLTLLDPTALMGGTSQIIFVNVSPHIAIDKSTGTNRTQLLDWSLLFIKLRHLVVKTNSASPFISACGQLSRFWFHRGTPGCSNAPKRLDQCQIGRAHV